MAQTVFKRYELKFMIDRLQYQKIIEEIPEYMQLDRYCKDNGSYMIYNLYFDNDTDDIIRKSISKPYYKEKLRLRSYKIPTCDDDTVFLELKKKIGGMVSKRRATLKYKDTKSFLNEGLLPEMISYTDRQVLNEICTFQKRFDSEPKVFLSYERVAFYGKDDHEFRVTFDKNILTRRDKPDFDNGDYGTELLDDGKYLMEVKTNGAFPIWFAGLLSNLKVYSTGFSKYGEEYIKYIRLQKNEKFIKPDIKKDIFWASSIPSLAV